MVASEQASQEAGQALQPVVPVAPVAIARKYPSIQPEQTVAEVQTAQPVEQAEHSLAPAELVVKVNPEEQAVQASSEAAQAVQLAGHL